MKVNEIMVGDIVLYEYDKKRFPARVEEIYLDSVLVEEVNGEYEPIEIEENELFPIPLTPEILEKNEFEKQDYPGWLIYTKEYMIQWRNDYPNVLSIDSFSSNYGSFKRFNVDYVHKLQHALRLCGIEKEITI